MTTGYLATGSCWPTATEALNAVYGADAGQIETISGTVYYFKNVLDAGVWKQNYYTLASGAFQLGGARTLPTNVYGTCTLPETSTGTGTGGTTTGTVSIVYPPVTYDYAAATAAWTFAVTIVVGTWMIAKNAGAIINAIKFW